MIGNGGTSREVQSVYEDIKKTRGINYIPNIWEIPAIAVSATNNCDYCIRSHTAATRKLGMNNEILEKLLTVIRIFNQTNRWANGCQIEVEEQYIRTE
jgi:AhpD family alkylhydroperoxidase